MARAHTPGARWHETFSLGGRLPWAVGLALCVTVGMSLGVALADRHAGLFDLVSLAPREVWRGQLWRLPSWLFVEPGPLALVFGCLFLYWFGRDLAEAWGSGRWLAIFGGVALASAVGTCLVAQVDAAVMARAYLGGWALSSSMVVAWGLWFPERVVRIYFILPIRGFWIAWLTVAVTVVYAVYAGWEGYLPELFAQGSILGWLYRRVVFARWARARRDRELRLRNVQAARRRASHRARGAAQMRLIEGADEDAPLPPELEDQVRELLAGRTKPRP